MGAKEKLNSNEVKLKIILFEIGEVVTGQEMVDVCLFGPSPARYSLALWH